MKFLFYSFCFVLLTVNVCGQTLPKEFFDGMDLMESNPEAAKNNFKLTIAKDSLFHGSYHFLGVISLAEKKPDSAIYYFKKSISLNTENLRHTREMTYVRLFNTYAYKHDLRNAFDIAWLAYKLYPNNNVILRGLEDICLWAFYTRHGGLDISYLSTAIKDEYVVNTIPQEYLIVRKLKIKDENLHVTSQSLVVKNKASYDVLNCATASGKDTVSINFKLNWDMNKEFGGKPIPTADVIKNTNYPVYERLGAILTTNNKADLKVEMEKLRP
ncbi:MAG: hypothetical protein EOP46_10170 [Sphingobacteriaceae bacterium]|nr:MAG: hypothetical protein EOP46_10170 [Sphingobacteriaceae bacterium]